MYYMNVSIPLNVVYGEILTIITLGGKELYHNDARYCAVIYNGATNPVCIKKINNTKLNII